MKFIPRNLYYSSLKNCVKEGIAAEIVIRALDFYLIPFALFLGATTRQISLLVSIPNLMSSIVIIFAQFLVSFLKSRQKVLFFSIGIQTLLLFNLIFLPFFRNLKGIIYLIIIISLFRTAGAVMGPVWGSLVSHYLTENQRGRYFGFRSRLVGFSGLLGTVIWAAVLSSSRYIPEEWAYVILFSSVFIARFFSFIFTKGMKDVPLDIHAPENPDGVNSKFLNFKKSISKYFPRKKFSIFIFYMIWMTFATQFALPFFSVWLRQELKFSYIWYTAIHLSSVVVGLIAYPLWGKQSDNYGNMRLLRFSNFLIGIIPLLWIFVHNPVGLIFIECFSGFVWAGFNLSSANFLYDVCNPKERINCLIVLNLLSGIAAFLGTFTGGFIIEHLPPLLNYSLLTLFLISSVLRFSGEFFISSENLEVRRVPSKVSSVKLFLSIIGFRPMTGQDPVHEESY